MAYLTIEQVQDWLSQSKYPIVTEDLTSQLELTAADVVRSGLSPRYDTSTWVNAASTPAFVINLMAMLVASYILRRAIGEDDGEHDYPDWLEGRVLAMIDAVINKQVDIPGVTPDPTAGAEMLPSFFPTDASTNLWKDDPLADGASALAFTMEMRF